jgi:hypothetical protein
MARFGLSSEPFRYERRFGSSVDLGKVEQLRTVIENVELADDRSLRSALERQLHTDDVRLLCEWSGYGSLFAETFPAAAAVDVLTTHPESFLADPSADTWVSPTSGFSALCAAMERALVDANVRVYRGRAVGAITITDASLGLEFTDGRTPAHGLAALILAVPPWSLQRIVHPWMALHQWAAVQVGVPLFKCFAEVGDHWWVDSDLDSTVFTGISPLQKLYFDSAREAIYWYCDSTSALRFRDIAADGSRILQIAANAIEKGVPLEPDAVTLGTTPVLQFWPGGIAYPRAGAAIPEGGMIRLASNIAYASDSLTPHIGWLEGGIASGQAAADSVLGNS